MSNAPDDPLWPEFKQLWRGLREAGEPVLIAGGYGLLLKQHWLRAESAVPCIVQLDRWLDVTARVTKDLDIVIGLDLIASESAQSRLSQVMTKCGFEVSKKNPRWQFIKKLTGRDILVEFHSPLPETKSEHLQTDKVRVKHRPSLGQDGIHGRQNAEAVGSEYHPFPFEIDDVSINVPNPVTWCNMKLTAMGDRWQKGQDQEREEEYRKFHTEHAIKHARDVCRAVAMTTRDENDKAKSIVDAIRKTEVFVNAAKICDRFFGRDNAWGVGVVNRTWRAEDLVLIRDTLARWFS